MHRDDARAPCSGSWFGAASQASAALLWFVAALGAVVSPAQACPKCEAGIEARGQVLDTQFGANLFWTVLPFLLIGLVCMAVNAIGRPSSPSPSLGPPLRSDPHRQRAAQGAKP